MSSSHESAHSQQSEAGPSGLAEVDRSEDNTSSFVGTTPGRCADFVRPAGSGSRELPSTRTEYGKAGPSGSLLAKESEREESTLPAAHSQSQTSVTDSGGSKTTRRLKTPLDDFEVALRLQLELINEHLAHSKAPVDSDQSYSFHQQQQDVSNALRFLPDARLARSVDNALETDYGMLAQEILLEEMALRDRDYARSFGEPQGYTQVAKEKCDVCLETQHISLRTPCEHKICYGCAKDLFEMAIKDEDLMPPRCCSNPFETDLAKCFLNLQQLERFNLRILEFRTQRKLYCSNQSCSRFLGSKVEAEERRAVICPSCRTPSCQACGAKAHDDHCAPVIEDKAVMELAEANSWKQCTNCHRIVELVLGCNHITCKCGHGFCYTCGVQWKGCRCAVWNEEMLTVRVADVADRQNIPARMVENILLRNNANDEECYDHIMEYHRGQAVCDTCDWLMPLFFFRCDNCVTTLCRRCHLFRTR